MAEDPYLVLGVSRDASDGDIRSSFRRLAKELHPDVNPGDSDAAERFKKVSQAYDIIGDREKRSKYDRGEIDAAGEPYHAFTGARAGSPFGRRRPAQSGEDIGLNNLFSDLFGGVGGADTARFQNGVNMRGQDVRYTLEVDFLEAALGARKRVTLPDGTVLDMSVPEGVDNGRVLRLKGKGKPGLGSGVAGDAHVEIKIRPHSDYTREGDNILLELPIGINEAILGAKIPVPTISGPVNLVIPKGTSSGRRFRLRGKGIRNSTAGTTGDQIVTVLIILPDRIDDSLAYFMSEWAQSNSYNPREKET